MWSDKHTEKMQSQEPIFDLECGSTTKELTLDEAVQVAQEGSIGDARFTLECAWSDQYCVEIQRPGKDPELLSPHDWG